MIFIGLLRVRLKMFHSAQKAQKNLRVEVCTESSSTAQLLPWSVGIDYLVISTWIKVCISEFHRLIHHSFKAFLLIPHQFQSQALPPPSQLPTLWLTPTATIQFMTRVITFSACLHFPCLLLCQIIVAFPELIFCQQPTPQHISLGLSAQRGAD